MGSGESEITALLAGLALAASATTAVLYAKYRTLKKGTKTPSIVKDSQANIFSESAFFYKNAQNRKEFCSPALKKLLGLPENVTIETLPAHLEKDDASRLKQALKAMSEGQKMFTITLGSPSGKRPPVLCIGKRFDDTPGEVKALMIYFYDVPDLSLQFDQFRNENAEAQGAVQNIRSIMDACPFPAWQRDKNLNIIMCNSTYEKIIEEPGTEKPTKIPELHASLKELATEALKAAKRQTLRQHIVVEGERRLFECIEIPLKEGGTAGFASDISSEEVLKSELEHYIEAQSYLLESSASAAAIFGTDMRIKFYNNSFMKLWELEEQFLSTHPTYVEILQRLRERRMLPEQADFQAYKKKQAALFTNVIDSYEEFMYLPDGKVLRVIVIPYALGGLLFSYEDMTEKITLERKYNTELAVKRATIDNLNEGVAVLAEDGRITLSNPVFANMWQLDPTMLEKSPHISEILEATKPYYDYGEDWAGFKQHTINSYFKRHTQVRRIERTDGSVIEWNGVPLPDGGTLMTYQDITDSTLVERSLRAEREALKEADSLKSSFLSNVSYELRSPLTSIKGFSEVLTKGYFGALNEKQKDYVEGIYNSSLVLSSLINDILDIASIDAGYMTLEVKEFDLYEVIASNVPFLKEKLRVEGVEFELQGNPDVGKILGDEKRISQIAVNLVNHALRFTTTDDKITMKVGGDTDMVFIGVHNTGKGIPASEVPHVFEKFYKTQRIENDSKHTATALALPVVKSFIELHGGKIDIVSDSDKGMEITCRLHRYNRDLLKTKTSKSAKKSKQPKTDAA